jgi:hypothetical protein
MARKQKHENGFHHAISISSYLACYYTVETDLEVSVKELKLREHIRRQILEVASQITHKQLTILSDDLKLGIKRPPLSIVNDESIESGIVIMVFDVQGNTAPYLHPNYNKVPDHFFEYVEYSDEDMLKMGYYDELSDEEVDTMVKKDFFEDDEPKSFKKKRGKQ